MNEGEARVIMDRWKVLGKELVKAKKELDRVLDKYETEEEFGALSQKDREVWCLEYGIARGRLDGLKVAHRLMGEEEKRLRAEGGGEKNE